MCVDYRDSFLGVSQEMARQTRREFIEQSIFAAAAASFAAMPRPTRAATETKGPRSPNEKLHVACVGVNGRGRDHMQWMLRPGSDVEITAIVDVDEAVGKSPRRLCTEAHAQGSQVLPRHSQDARGPVDRHRLDRHAEPLAQPGGDLGDPGRQGRVCRKAGQPQREGGAAARAGGPQVQPHRAGRHAEPIPLGREGGHRLRPLRKSRRGETRAGAVLQDCADRSGRKGSTRSPSRSITTCGSVPPPKSRSRGRACITTGTGSGTTATAIWATREFTRWTSAAGASTCTTSGVRS